MSTLGPRQVRALSDAQRNKIIALRRQAVPTRKIAERFGCSREVIMNIVKGVKPESVGCGGKFFMPMGRAGLLK
jgi:hypothetical protein